MYPSFLLIGFNAGEKRMFVLGRRHNASPSLSYCGHVMTDGFGVWDLGFALSVLGFRGSLLLPLRHRRTGDRDACIMPWAAEHHDRA